MDIISHALWTNLIFKELPLEQRSLAISFGVLPDIISFSLTNIKYALQKVFHYTDPPLIKLPKITFRLYNYTHSLVVWLGVFFVLKVFGLDWLALAFLAGGYIYF